MASGIAKDIGEEALAIVTTVSALVSSFLAWRTSTIRELRREVDDLRDEKEEQYDQMKELMDENLHLLADRAEHDAS